MNEKLVWIDIESTGLLQEEDTAMLAIGIIITDGQATVLTQAEYTIWQPESVLANMRPTVRKMHESSGLTQRVREAKEDESEVEERLMRIVAAFTEMKRCYMAGSSIAGDRARLMIDMPALHQWMHYRLVDVSALKAMRQAMGLPRYEDPEPKLHTPLADLFASIRAYKYYMNRQMM